MKRIVRGNDFTMRIPVVKIVKGEKVAFPLPGCTDIVVRLCSAYRRLELAYTIDAKEDNVIVARVEGDRIPLGTYALEVRGKIFGNDWRSNEYEQVAIVDRNADADTELGETDEGENSVEMDTAVVVLPPDRELEALVKEAQAQNKAMSELSDTIKVSEEGRAEAEKNRNAAEDTRTRTEIEREANELTRKSNEAKRQDNETARQDNEAKRKETEQKRENDTTSAISTMQTKTDEAVKTMQTKTDTATASMDEHRTAFDDAEATRVSNEQARVAAEEKREKAEELRVKNEESRQTNEQARITAETKRESDMAQAVDKANTASDIAISANDPFVWMPFADLEHWNITAMDLATGTVTLSTEDHGLQVGDGVVVAAKMSQWTEPYKLGSAWEHKMKSKNLKAFPVKKRSASPAVTVTSVNGAQVQCDGLKVSTGYVVDAGSWVLQRVATGGRTIPLPDRYKGRPLTICVEGQYMTFDNNWNFYNPRHALLDKDGKTIFGQFGDEICGLPFVKMIYSARSGHHEFVDVGTSLYGEGVTLGIPTNFGSSNKDDWDVTKAVTLKIDRCLCHYATRVTLTPYRDLTLLGGVEELKQMQSLKQQWFAANAMIAREYWLPTCLFSRDMYEYQIPMRSGFYCKVKVLDHDSVMCIAGGYVFSSSANARATNYLWVKNGHLAYNPTIGTSQLEETGYTFDSDWHEVYVSWGDTWDRTWIDGALVMEHTNVSCRQNNTSKIFVHGYNALDHRTNVPNVGAAVIQGPVLLFWDGEVKAWHCGLSAKEDDDVARGTLCSNPVFHTYNGSIHDGQGGCPSADCTGLIHCEGTGTRAYINIFGTWKSI